ncbi:hypothetical protein [Iamia sp.]|uniref:hypothetical protein n=1 Tax=Iamia sp. TaxID=2722710 RepID=UPI002CC83295|nr:hypothetical protein [Iamia sp.]HXH59088.1 hypothetical protein [Iamia sp.]
MRTKIDRSDAIDGIPRVVGVRKTAGDTYDGACSCGFRSSGWPKRGQAEERIEQHVTEHGTGDAAPELVEHLRATGLSLQTLEPVLFSDEPTPDEEL